MCCPTRGPDLQLANLLCKSSGETLSNAFVKPPPLRIVYWDHRNPLAVWRRFGEDLARGRFATKSW